MCANCSVEPFDLMKGVIKGVMEGVGKSHSTVTCYTDSVVGVAEVHVLVASMGGCMSHTDC